MTDDRQPSPDASSPSSDAPADEAGAGVPKPARSPIRPDQPDQDAPRRPRLAPLKPATGKLQQEQPSDDRPQPPAAETDSKKALARLREQMSQVAQEYADGKLNRAQFNAIYNRYNEQRSIIERLVARDPATSAWRQVAQQGHTTFLREHFAAKILFYALFSMGNLTPIIQHGSQPPPGRQVRPILKKLPGLLQQKGVLAPAYKKLPDGHWLAIVPGQYTVSISVYSLEPSAQQLTQIADLHHDFERANIHTIASGVFSTDRLVFPQRSLLEQKPGTNPL